MAIFKWSKCAVNRAEVGNGNVGLFNNNNTNLQGNWQLKFSNNCSGVKVQYLPPK